MLSSESKMAARNQIFVKSFFEIVTKRYRHTEKSSVCRYLHLISMTLGGGRVGFGDNDPLEVLALAQEYGIFARLTFSNSLLCEEHLSNRKCNRLCAMFAEAGGNGVIVHSDLLLDYLQKYYPELYLVSSTTKVLTDFAELEAEVRNEKFRYVVPDFRLNKAFDIDAENSRKSCIGLEI